MVDNRVPKPGECSYGNGIYSEGSLTCQAGQVMECKNGKWESVRDGGVAKKCSKDTPTGFQVNPNLLKNLLTNKTTITSKTTKPTITRKTTGKPTITRKIIE